MVAQSDVSLLNNNANVLSAPVGGNADHVQITTVDLWHSYKRIPSIRGVSLGVHRGEVYGLIGPDGAGKTTLLRLIAGLLDPLRGGAFVFGEPAASASARVRSGVGYMPQRNSLYGDLTVDENLSFFASLFCLSRGVFAERRAMLLHLTRLERFTDRRADALSGGMYKKLGLACALLHSPRVLVLDEPTNGLDPISRRDLWGLIGTFVAGGMCVMLTTPYMDEASRCTRVGLLHEGRLLRQGDPNEMLRTFSGLAFRVECGDRNALASRLDRVPSVIALSPSGGALRVLMAPDGRRDLESVATEMGAVLHPVHAVFADVFLGILRDYNPVKLQRQ